MKIKRAKFDKNDVDRGIPQSRAKDAAGHVRLVVVVRPIPLEYLILVLNVQVFTSEENILEYLVW